jgi:hypothetical protein
LHGILRAHHHLTRAAREHPILRTGAHVRRTVHALDTGIAQEPAEHVSLKLGPDHRKSNKVAHD